MVRTTIVIDAEEYYERAYGGWLGKNVGGTLGEPVEGRKELLDLDFYPELPGDLDPDEHTHYPKLDDDEPAPLANDDLDLQLVWLHGLEQYGPDISARELGQEWLDHVFFPYNEYRYALANLRRGIDPPVSGVFNNEFYNDCMGAPIRSEVWAMVCPGAPDAAVQYAYRDAIVDHAGGEGVYGEMFNAALESAAFVVDDIQKLLEIGLSFIPEDCRLARAVRDTIHWHADGLEWTETRKRVLAEYGNQDITNAPQNHAFVVIGLLYGDSFEDALLKCVNSGYDTDSSGALIGSILGIREGRDGIPAKWVDPIGHRVVTRPQIRGFPVPEDLGELTDRTLAMARRVIADRDLPIDIVSEAETSDPADPVSQLTSWTEEAGLDAMWNADPWIHTVALPRGSGADPSTVVEIDYGDGGPAIGVGQEKTLMFSVTNESTESWDGRLSLDVPEEWKGPDDRSYSLAAGDTAEWTPTITAGEELRSAFDLSLEIHREHDGSPWTSRSVDVSLAAATHWRLSGPGDDERSVVAPSNRVDVSALLGVDEPGTYRAESTLLNPRDRRMILDVRSAAPVSVSLGNIDSGEIAGENGQHMLSSLWLGADRGGIELPAGEYDLELVFEARQADLPLSVYVIPAGPPEPETPGELYFLTDVLFA